MCGVQKCKGNVEGAERVFEDLEPTSGGERRMRVSWRRRRWRCPSPSCPLDIFLEEDGAVDAFNERVRSADARFSLRPAVARRQVGVIIWRSEHSVLPA